MTRTYGIGTGGCAPAEDGRRSLEDRVNAPTQPASRARSDQGISQPIMALGLAALLAVAGGAILIDRHQHDHMPTNPPMGPGGPRALLPLTALPAPTPSATQPSATTTADPGAPATLAPTAAPSVTPSLHVPTKPPPGFKVSEHKMTPVPAAAGQIASTLVAAQHSFTSDAVGPNTWVADSKAVLSPALYAYETSELGDLIGPDYSYWDDVESNSGSQTTTIDSVIVDDTQKATNTATHVSLLVSYEVTTHGWGYPTTAPDPTGITQAEALNLTLGADGKWRVDYLIDHEDAPSAYGHLQTGPKGNPIPR